MEAVKGRRVWRGCEEEDIAEAEWGEDSCRLETNFVNTLA